jgi:hypothetical protein
MPTIETIITRRTLTEVEKEQLRARKADRLAYLDSIGVAHVSATVTVDSLGGVPAAEFRMQQELEEIAAKRWPEYKRNTEP